MIDEEPASLFEPGMVIERIELIERLGRGVQAEVWSARNLEFPGQSLAVKLWYSKFDERTEHVFQERHRRLDQEAALLAKVDSPHIITPRFRITDRLSINDADYIVFGIALPLASEGNLHDFLASTGPKLSMLDRLRLMEQLAAGLVDLQHANIIHNDVKPQNILISKREAHFSARFADFGIAFRSGEPSVGGGTIAYMAPELLSEAARPSFGAQASFKTDIFALGIVFFEILLGHHPLERIIGRGDPSRALKGYFATQQYIAFDESHEYIDENLSEIVQLMCSRDPSMRPAMMDVVEAIEDVIFKLRGQASIALNSVFPDAADRFRWSEAAHAAFRESERLVFLRGPKSSVDPKFLADTLHERRLYGFSLFRLLGSRDYLLRVWVREQDVIGLQDVLERYRINRSGEHFVFEPELRWPTPLQGRVRAALERPSDVLQAIAHLARAPTDEAIRKAKRQGLIIGQSKLQRERDKPRKAIRVVTRISASRNIKRELLLLLGQQIFDRLNAFDETREVEVFASSGGSQGSAWFILIVEIQHFHVYREALEIVENTLSALTSNEPFQFRSHLEMDPVAQYESYDGRLFRELRRREHGSTGGHNN